MPGMFNIPFIIEILFILHSVNGEIYKAVCTPLGDSLPSIMLQKNNVLSREECAVLCKFAGGVAFSLSENKTCSIYTEHFKIGSCNVRDADKKIKYYNRKTLGKCPDGWYQHAAQCFYNSTSSRVPWDTAKQHCLELGGHLATIRDNATNSFLIEIMNPDRQYWLGGTDQNVHGTWIWEGNIEPLTFTFWGNKQPNNVKKRQHCLLFIYHEYDHAMKWNDRACSTRHHYLCQITL